MTKTEARGHLRYARDCAKAAHDMLGRQDPDAEMLNELLNEIVGAAATVQSALNDYYSDDPDDPENGVGDLHYTA